MPSSTASSADLYVALLDVSVHGALLLLLSACVAICVYLFQEFRDLGDVRANAYDSVPTMNTAMFIECVCIIVLLALSAFFGQWPFLVGLIPLAAYEAHAHATGQQKLSMVDVNQYDVRARAHKVTTGRLVLYCLLAFGALYLLAHDITHLLVGVPFKIRAWRLTVPLF